MPGEDGRIVFTSTATGDLFTMNADGSGLAQLTDDPEIQTNPAWSPDGTRIAYEQRSGPVGPKAIYVMNADGTGQTRLTANAVLDWQPAWSPDGRRIAFTSKRDGRPVHELYVMSADGGAATPLTANSPASNLDPTWSPDGARIAFRSFDDNDSEIWVVNADGSGKTRLTDNSTEDYAPAWSPGGRRIAYGGARGSSSELFVMNADGSGERQLTSNDIYDDEPDWQTLPPRVVPPDGHVIVDYPGPARDVDGPAVAISRRTVRVTRAGVLSVRLGCPAGEPGGCRGRLTLRTIVRRRTVNLGSTLFAIPAGRSTAVTLRLSRMKRTLLQKRRQVRVTATVRAVDQAGNARISTATFTVKAPKSRKRS